MTDDRFAARLRQHLLETANERPAAGQVETLLERVAVTRQRPAIAHRLISFPAAFGPVPSAALRYGLIAAALVGALSGIALLGGGGRPAGTVFEGTWTSTDPGDGSFQVLVVGSGASPAVHFVDELATGGACVDDPVKVFTADGVGSTLTGQLHITWPEGGGCGLMTVPIEPWLLAYDETTDTLGDGGATTWRPAARSVAVPTRAPVPSQLQTAPRPTATDRVGCIDFPDGGTYSAPVDALLLTATLPVGGDASWAGLRDQFSLTRGPCAFRGTTWLETDVVDHVYADACDRTGPAIEVGTASEAIAALTAQQGHQLSEPSSLTIGGYPASRFDISVPSTFDPSTCTEGWVQLWDGAAPLDPGRAATVFLIDLDGLPLTLVAYGLDEGAPPAVVAEIEAIVASLQIER